MFNIYVYSMAYVEGGNPESHTMIKLITNVKNSIHDSHIKHQGNRSKHIYDYGQIIAHMMNYWVLKFLGLYAIVFNYIHSYITVKLNNKLFFIITANLYIQNTA